MLLHDLFADAVRSHGSRLAIDVPPVEGRPQRQTATYAELAAQATAIALQLRPLVARECVVAILLHRDSPRLYAAQLGVLQAGAAHACFDPSYPDAHLDFLLQDSAAVAVLTDAEGERRLAGGTVPIVRVDRLAPAPAGNPPLPTPPWQNERSLAYVIYTSGTTGKPKGVLIEHRGVVSLIRSGAARFALGPGDRCAQGSSAAYDSSIEETWLPLAAGATVVTLDEATVRLGPDLVAWLRRERVTMFCPPPTLLRAMDCRDPRQELPDLRLCYVGGEAMPQDLCDLWGSALWLENGYGPTECTVTVVRGRLLPGKSVIIGLPVPGHDALLLGDDGNEVRDGDAGELCLRGVGLARGYLNQPELTEQRFPQHPRYGRIYRTGDLARRDADGQLVCLGRIDAQVKVRGHRIELEAVEAALAQCVGVREAACRLQQIGGVPSLAAFLVAADPSVPMPAAAVLERDLRARVPEPMVPARFTFVAELPRTIGGKLDRKALPATADGDATPCSCTNGVAHGAAARTPHGRIAAAFANCIGRATVADDDDFFACGGDSLRAAQLISRLRRDPDTASLAVRDVYELRTVAALAARAATGAAQRALGPTAGRPHTAPVSAPGSPALATIVHVAWLLTTLTVGASAGYLIGFVLMPALVEGLGLLGLVLLTPLLGGAMVLAYAVASLWFAVLLKQLLIGRYQPGRVPVWTSLHVRHWLVVRAARLVPWQLLQGTALHAAALRMLGARVGRRVYISRAVDLARGGWDLLTIGDGAVLGREAHVELAELEQGHLVFGSVQLGERSVLDTRAGVGRGAVVGDDAVIAALAYVPPGTSVPAGELWDGVPARSMGRAPAAPAVEDAEQGWSALGFAVLVLCGRTFAAPLLPGIVLAGLLAVAAGVTTDECVQWLWGSGTWSRPLWTTVLLVCSVLGVPLQLLVEALLLRWTCPIPVGTHSLWSAVALRTWMRIELLESAGSWLAGTMFWPAWLRLAGARVGRNCEISTIVDVLPEHLEIGDECFLADGIYLGVPRLRAGTLTVAPTSLGARSFFGNHVVIHAGTRLPPDVLLGVATVGDPVRMANGGSWFGLPPMRLPQREIITMDRSLTHDPGSLRWATRVFWEVLRVALPAWPLWLWLGWWDVVGAVATEGSLAAVLGTVVLATAVCFFVLAATVLVTKWALLGRVRPGQHALWSCWASRWDFHYVLWERYGRVLLTQLEQTLLLPWFLRGIGVKVGRRVVLGEGFAQVVDPDMLQFDDGATVHALFQAHSFEDRVLKIDRVRIGRGATVARGTVILYGADIGDGAFVAPHGVVMKHEHLQPGRHYEGAPLFEVEAPPPRDGGERATINALPQPVPREREPALDAARGIAVLGMVWMHFVPEGTDAAIGGVTDAISAVIHGKAAALFAVLAGMTWALQADRRRDPQLLRAFVVRRTLTLALAGALFWRYVWPTEILLPLALMLPVVMLAWRRRAGPLLAAIAGMLLLVPIVTATCSHWLEIDCREDGTHLANATFGWGTLRYFLFDGSYPLLPWLCFPLLGAALVARGAAVGSRGLTDAPRWARRCALALPLALAMQLLSSVAESHADSLGAWAPYLQATWQPTSVPFVLQNASWAMALISLLAWWHAAKPWPRALVALAPLGRASLTHYVLHVLLVYEPLRWTWPDEDWPLAVGLAAAAGYALCAVPLSNWWFRSRRRGPVEALLAAASGGVPERAS